jgi:hypothetical protein
VQASDSAARLAAEAEDTELRYNKARLGELSCSGMLCWTILLFAFWTAARAYAQDTLLCGFVVLLSHPILKSYWPELHLVELCGSACHQRYCISF